MATIATMNNSSMIRISVDKNCSMVIQALPGILYSFKGTYLMLHPMIPQNVLVGKRDGIIKDKKSAIFI
jgi:hypothetical protein